MFSIFLLKFILYWGYRSFKGFYNRFLYINKFPSSKKMFLLYLVIPKCLKGSTFQRCCILTSLQVLKDILVPNKFFVLSCSFICKITFLKKICSLEIFRTKSLDQNLGVIFYLQTFKDVDVVKMMKEQNFLHVVELSLNERFGKYYRFNLQQ